MFMGRVLLSEAGMACIHCLYFDELACVALRQSEGCMEMPRTAFTALEFDHITRFIGLDSAELKVFAERMMFIHVSELKNRVKL